MTTKFNYDSGDAVTLSLQYDGPQRISWLYTPETIKIGDAIAKSYNAKFVAELDTDDDLIAVLYFNPPEHWGISAWVDHVKVELADGRIVELADGQLVESWMKVEVWQVYLSFVEDRDTPDCKYFPLADKISIEFSIAIDELQDRKLMERLPWSKYEIDELAPVPGNTTDYLDLAIQEIAKNDVLRIYGNNEHPDAATDQH